MTTASLQDYDRLVGRGFAEDQARALVETFATSSDADPAIARSLERLSDQMEQINARLDNIDSRLDNIESRLDKVEVRLDSIEARLDRVEDKVDKLEERVTKVETGVHELRSEIHIIDERMKSESRTQRMINTTLIAIGAMFASLLAVFAR